MIKKSRRKYNILGILGLAVLLTLSAMESCSSVDDKPQNTKQSSEAGVLNLPHWSKTSPSINLQHIFYGEINRSGKPVGYHSRPQAADPRSARIKSIKSKPNKSGVYTADIEIYDKSGKQWKSKFSSFFPDDFTSDDVIRAVLNAYKNRNKSKQQPWSGPSGHGFVIQGYLNREGKINTAFPVYRRN